MPESLSAFCKMVSFTAAKTSRIFDVSVACVRLDDEDQRGSYSFLGALTVGKD